MCQSYLANIRPSKDSDRHTLKIVLKRITAIYMALISPMKLAIMSMNDLFVTLTCVNCI